MNDEVLAKAAAMLGTTTKKETIGRALELAARDQHERDAEARSWDEWADSVGDRLAEVDWERAWR